VQIRIGGILDQGFFFVVVLRLRPALIRASFVLPSTPPLSHSRERHFLDGQFDGFSVSGIHLCLQTSQTATRIVLQPMQPLYRIMSIGHNTVDVWRDSYNMSDGHNTSFPSPRSGGTY
jgi:hypothetical protein